jgi:hypothetical protein
MTDNQTYMGDGSGNVNSGVLSEQIRSQADVIDKISKAMDKILWIISDPDVGLVKRLGENGKITGDTVVAQTAMLTQIGLLTTAVASLQVKQGENITEVKAATADIKDLKAVNTTEVEAKKPMLAIGWKIVEYLLLTAVVGAIIWVASLLQK